MEYSWSNWAGDEPDDGQGVATKYRTGTWRDRDTTDPYKYICKKMQMQSIHKKQHIYYTFRFVISIL